MNRVNIFWEPGQVPEGSDRAFHHRHTDEQHAEAQQNLAEVMELPLFGKHEDGGADAHGHIGQHGGLEQLHDDTVLQGTGGIQTQQLSGDGGADVGAHDDAHGLTQVRDAGVDEAHHHNCGCRRTLDDAGDQGADADGLKDVAGNCFQGFFQLFAGHFLQGVAHGEHAVDEKSQAA